MCRRGTLNPRIIYVNNSKNVQVIYRVRAGGFIDDGQNFTNSEHMGKLISEIRENSFTFNGPVTTKHNSKKPKLCKQNEVKISAVENLEPKQENLLDECLISYSNDYEPMLTEILEDFDFSFEPVFNEDESIFF